MSSKLWEGEVEIKYFDQWVPRQMDVVGDVCRYYAKNSPTEGTPIKLTSSTQVQQHGEDIITITTTESSGMNRDTQVRISARVDRILLVAVLNQVITSGIIMSASTSNSNTSPILSPNNIIETGSDKSAENIAKQQNSTLEKIRKYQANTTAYPLIGKTSESPPTIDQNLIRSISRGRISRTPSATFDNISETSSLTCDDIYATNNPPVTRRSISRSRPITPSNPNYNAAEHSEEYLRLRERWKSTGVVEPQSGQGSSQGQPQGQSQGQPSTTTSIRSTSRGRSAGGSISPSFSQQSQQQQRSTTPSDNYNNSNNNNNNNNNTYLADNSERSRSSQRSRSTQRSLENRNSNGSTPIDLRRPLTAAERDDLSQQLKKRHLERKSQSPSHYRPPPATTTNTSNTAQNMENSHRSHSYSQYSEHSQYSRNTADNHSNNNFHIYPNSKSNSISGISGIVGSSRGNGEYNNNDNGGNEEVGGNHHHSKTDFVFFEIGPNGFEFKNWNEISSLQLVNLLLKIYAILIIFFIIASFRTLSYVHTISFNNAIIAIIAPISCGITYHIINYKCSIMGIGVIAGFSFIYSAIILMQSIFWGEISKCNPNDYIPGFSCHPRAMNDLSIICDFLFVLQILLTGLLMRCWREIAPYSAPIDIMEPFYETIEVQL